MLSTSVSVKKSLVLAEHSKNRISVKTGAVGYVSNDEVQSEADFFDTDLNNFLIEIDENPVFGLRQYEKFTDEAKKAQHQKFVTAISGLVYDWRGDDDEQMGKFDFFPGYYRKLKKSNWAGSTEMAEIKAFEKSLNDRREQYKSLSYKLDIKPVEPPSAQKKDIPGLNGMDIPWGWITVVGVVVVGAIVVGQLLPAFAATKVIGGMK